MTAQNMFTSVDTAIRAIGSETFPKDTVDLIGTGSTMLALQRHHRQEPGIRLALSTLLDAGCTTVVLKGLALAYSRYPTSDQRVFADIDLLLPEHELDRANQALLNAGFSVAASNTLGDGHQHLPPLFAPRQAVVVELHRALYEDACPFYVDTRALLERSRPTTILGFQVRQLDPVDALLHVSAHLSYGHRYERYPLRSLADILVIIRSGEVDWSLLVSRARAAHMEGAVVWPLALARAWLGAPVPVSVLRALAPAPPLRRLIAAVMYSGYVLDRSSVEDDGSRVLFDLILNVSVFTGCSMWTQAQVFLNGLFPSPEGVTHLAPEISESPMRYSLELTRLDRLGRGAGALMRLIRRTVRHPHQMLPNEDDRSRLFQRTAPTSPQPVVLQAGQSGRVSWWGNRPGVGMRIRMHSPAVMGVGTLQATGDLMTKRGQA